jgi:hypothetical protein
VAVQRHRLGEDQHHRHRARRAQHHDAGDAHGVAVVAVPLGLAEQQHMLENLEHPEPDERDGDGQFGSRCRRRATSTCR